MRKIVRFAVVVAMALTALTAVALPSTRAAGKSIVDVAAADGRFTVLLAALKETGLDKVLDGNGPYTFFAPTDTAFTNTLNLLGISTEAFLADTDLLTNVLRYHIVSGTMTAEEVAALTSAKTLEGSAIRVVEGGPFGVQLNGSSNMIAPDLEASNGVIHVIDNVLWPPKNIVSLAAENNLSTFIEALDASGLRGTLSSGSYTVLAPTNDAFEKAYGVLGVTKAELFANKKLLKAVLLYHVIPGEVTAEKMGTLSSVSTLNGARITINGTSFNDGEAHVRLPDLIARNGVLHIIDSVLLPPEPEPELQSESDSVSRSE